MLNMKMETKTWAIYTIDLLSFVPHRTLKYSIIPVIRILSTYMYFLGFLILDIAVVTLRTLALGKLDLLTILPRET